jgi:hypothetical protein
MTGQTVRQSRRVKRSPRKLTQDPRLGRAAGTDQRPKAIRPSGITRLTRILADARMRNAPTIAGAAVAAAKVRGASLTGGPKARVPTARCIQHGIPEHRRRTASRKSSLGPAVVSVAIAGQIVEVILPSRVTDPLKECSSADDQRRCGDGRA